MGEEEANKMEASEPKEMQQPALKEDMENHDAAEEKKSVIPVPQKIAAAAPVKEKSPNKRDSVLARVETEKRLALVKAWEENEKAKVDNKAHKKISAIGSWKNTKKADVEAQLKSIEEKLERKKAEYAEKMKNKVAELHKEAEEKRARIEAKKGEDFLKIEENAAEFRSTGFTPKKFLGCFSGSACISVIQHETWPYSYSNKARAPSRLASYFSGTQEKCGVCNKTAYPLEKVTVEGENCHKSSFRCSPGGCFLTPSSYSAMDGILYCKHHFAQLFMEKGCYSNLTRVAYLKKNSAVSLLVRKPEAALESEDEPKPKAEAEAEEKSDEPVAKSQ